MSFLRSGMAALIALTIVAGCSQRDSTDVAAGGPSELLAPSPMGTDFARSRSLFPLAVGNYWLYRVRTHYQILGPGAPAPVDGEGTYFVNIAGTATYDGRDYFLQSEGDPRQGNVGVAFPVRSSRFGLFELMLNHASQARSDAVPVDPVAGDLSAYVDRAIADPVKRAAYQRAAAALAAKVSAMRPAPGGQSLVPPPHAVPDELTVLSYPLYAGARWVVRKDPNLARIVEARERINVPLGTFAAWRIRNVSELYGPNDRVHFWYSSLGLLRFRVHAETNATDSTGAIIGRVAIDSDRALTDVHLVRASAALVSGSNPAE